MFSQKTISETHLFKYGFFDYLIYVLSVPLVYDSDPIMYELDNKDNLVIYTKFDIKQIILN